MQLKNVLATEIMQHNAIQLSEGVK